MFKQPLFFLSILILFLLFIFSSFSDKHTDESYPLTNSKLSKEFHKGRREALRQKLPQGSVAIFFSNPVRNKSNDVDFPYHQDPDFYYLTGFTESNAVLVLYKEPQKIDGKAVHDILFVPAKDERWELWNGTMMGVEKAKKQLGIEKVLISAEFKDFLLNAKPFQNLLYKPFPFEINDDVDNPVDLFDLKKIFENIALKSPPNVNTSDLQKYMSELREIKSNEEIVLLNKAIEITVKSQMEVFKVLRPDMTEFQIQGVIEFVYQLNGAKVGFPSIVGSGENSCILHYTTNNRKFSSNDMIVVDIGAEVHGYTADITRTLPVDGTFSEEQSIIYNLVLEAQNKAIEACVPGIEFKKTKEICIEVIGKGLAELGIIKSAGDYKKYFMHGVSHYLGLDVHDAGTFGNLKPGNVITVEPGIYIKDGSDCDKKWWNIGVRIEDDILITEDGYEILSSGIPKEITEIENIMKQESQLSEFILNFKF